MSQIYAQVALKKVLRATWVSFGLFFQFNSNGNFSTRIDKIGRSNG